MCECKSVMCKARHVIECALFLFFLIAGMAQGCGVRSSSSKACVTICAQECAGGQPARCQYPDRAAELLCDFCECKTGGSDHRDTRVLFRCDVASVILFSYESSIHF